MVWVVWAILAAGVGDERISVDVEWDAPESCPPRARFEAELRARSNRLRIVQAPEVAEAHVAMKIVEQKKRFTGVTKLSTTLSGVTTREFKSAQCETLVQAAALATSLLLDPEGTKLGTVTLTEPPPPIVDAGVAVELEVDAGVPVVEPIVVDAGVTPLPDPLPREGRGREEDRPVAVFVGGGVTSAISGAVDPLVQASITFSFGRVQLELTPQFVFGRRVSSSAGVAQYFGVGGRVAGAVGFSLLEWLRFEVGVHVTLLAVPASAPEAEIPGTAVGFRVAPGALGRFVFSFGKFRVALEGLAGLNTRQERDVISGTGAVFTAPLFFGTGVVAVGWAL